MCIRDRCWRLRPGSGRRAAPRAAHQLPPQGRGGRARQPASSRLDGGAGPGCSPPKQGMAAIRGLCDAGLPDFATD
eukprot:4751578-Alexandrium_andersonii.AAC.1